MNLCRLFSSFFTGVTTLNARCPAILPQLKMNILDLLTKWIKKFPCGNKYVCMGIKYKQLGTKAFIQFLYSLSVGRQIHWYIAYFTVVHNCHGKRNNLAAKRKRLTTKEKTSRRKKKPHGERKNLTAKEKTSRRKKKPHGERKNLTAKEKTSRRKKKTHGKRKTLRHRK